MKKNNNIAILSALTAGMVLIAGNGWAQGQSPRVTAEPINVQLFAPAADDSPYLVTYGSKTLPQLDFNTSLFFNYAEGLAMVAQQSDPKIEAVRAVLTADIGFAIGLFDFMQANVGLPIHLYASTSDINQKDYSGGTFLGDFRAEVKFSVLKEVWGFFGLGFLPFVTIPTGADEKYLGDKDLTFGLGAIADFDLRFVKLAANLGYRVRNEVKTPKQTIDDEIFYRAGANVPIWDGLEFIGDTFGSTVADDFFENRAGNPLEIDLALRYNFDFGLTLTGGGGRGWTQGLGAPNLRVFLGVAYCTANDVQVESEDRDGDGILNDADGCPDDEEDFDEFEDEDGCPDIDNDQDGIEDEDDQCPDLAETVNGIDDEDGCPEGDRDEDGIADALDACPEIAEDINGIEDDDGCPEGDLDGDQILDYLDACTDVAETYNGYQDEDGCPEPDKDLDGILDDNDKCPEQAETKNGYKDEDGCPDEKPAIIFGRVYDSSSTAPVVATISAGSAGKEVVSNIEDGSYRLEYEKSGTYSLKLNAVGYAETTTDVIAASGEEREINISMDRANDFKLDKLQLSLAPIFFVTGKALIMERSFGTLETVVEFLNNNPQTRIKIYGHTDNTGSKVINRRLSKLRAGAVVDFLSEKGIDRTRMISEGFGEDQPIADNSTADGRSKNRRVEFFIEN